MTSHEPSDLPDTYLDDQGSQGYAVNAEFYDLIFPEAVRDGVRAALTDLLGDARQVVEIGAGTGLFTQMVLDLTPSGTQVVAVEPAAVMRAGITARFAGQEAARERLTVLPAGALEVPWPVDAAPVEALLMLHVLTHLSPQARERVWATWMPRLSDSALLVVDTQWPQEPCDVPESVMPGGRMGRHRFEARAGAEALDDGRVAWTMTYRRLDGDDLVQEESVTFPSHVVSDSQLDAELAPYGMARVETVHPGVRVWRRTS